MGQFTPTLLILPNYRVGTPTEFKRKFLTHPCEWGWVRWGWGGGRKGSEKGISKAINKPAKIKVQVKTKSLKFRVLESPLKYFQVLSYVIYNGALVTTHSTRGAKMHNAELGGRNSGS